MTAPVMTKRHLEWSTCMRCGTPGQITAGPARSALCDTGDYVTCWNGRECSLRLARARRNRQNREVNRG